MTTNKIDFVRAARLVREDRERKKNMYQKNMSKLFLIVITILFIVIFFCPYI